LLESDESDAVKLVGKILDDPPKIFGPKEDEMRPANRFETINAIVVFIFLDCYFLEENNREI
jgi:hypothetical protein